MPVFSARDACRAYAVSKTSIRPSVRLYNVGELWSYNAMHRRYFDTTRKGNHCSFLTPTLVGGSPILSEICAQSDSLPFETRRLPQISTYNVSTIRDSEKSSIMTNRKSTTGFPTSYKWSAYVTPKSPKYGSKSDFSFFKINFTLYRLKSATKFHCVKTSSSKVVA